MAACGAFSSKSSGDQEDSEDLIEYYTKEHLRECKFKTERYEKLLKILNKLRKDSTNSEEFLVKFANKCYHRETDRDRAKSEAKRFLESVFGPIKQIFSLGPEKAIKGKVKELYLNKENSDDSKDDSDDEMVMPVKIRDKALSEKKKKKKKKKEEAKDGVQWQWQLGERFKVGPVLGEGGTAKVHLALDTSTNKKVAMKILKPKYRNTAVKELEVLKNLNHDNIIRVFEYFPKIKWEKEKTCAFVVELANGGELIEYMMFTGKFEPNLARWFMEKLVAGVNYCHQQKVVHRDLKHDNCLLDDYFQVKITDFGFARYFDKDKDTMTTAIGTPQYAAPEILKRNSYDEKVDIFSLGVMLFITLSGSQPWRKADKSGDKWYQMWVAKRDKFWSYHEKRNEVEFGSDAKELLEGMLAHKPRDRFAMTDVMQCKWMNDRDKCTDEEARGLLKKRKKDVDAKRRGQSLMGGNPADRKGDRKAVHDKFLLPILAAKYRILNNEGKRRPLPLTAFKTKDDPKHILTMFEKAIDEMRGSITERYEDYAVMDNGAVLPEMDFILFDEEGEFVALPSVDVEFGGETDVEKEERLKIEALFAKDEATDERRIEADFEVKFFPLGENRLLKKKGDDGSSNKAKKFKDFDNGNVVVRAKIAMYRDSDEKDAETVVMFTPLPTEKYKDEKDLKKQNEDTKLYLPKVFNDIMDKLGFLRTDHDGSMGGGDSTLDKEEAIIAESGLKANKIPRGMTKAKKKRSGAACG